MATAFQSNAFQTNAFQIDGGSPPPPPPPDSGIATGGTGRRGGLGGRRRLVGKPTDEDVRRFHAYLFGKKKRKKTAPPLERVIRLVAAQKAELPEPRRREAEAALEMLQTRLVEVERGGIKAAALFVARAAEIERLELAFAYLEAERLWAYNAAIEADDEEIMRMWDEIAKDIAERARKLMAERYKN